MLEELYNELHNQDNRSTQHPLFVVYDKEQIPTSEDYADNFEYVDGYEGDTIGSTATDLIDYANNNDLELPNEDDLREMDEDDLYEWMKEHNKHCKDYWFKGYYKEVDKFITAFFTEKAAREFITANNYHYRKPHIFVHGLWRNYEMIHIRNSLMNKPVKIKEMEYQTKDMQGKVVRKPFWHIVENPIASIPEHFPKPTGRWRYREIVIADKEKDVKIYPDCMKNDK